MTTALRGELGDLLFQVYFLSLLLEERGEGDLEAVAREVHEKLVRRHPHVFGDADARDAGPRARALGGAEDRAGGAGRDLPRRSRGAAGAAPGAEGAAPGRHGRLRLARPRRPAREGATRSSASSSEHRGRGVPAPETEPDAAVFDELGDLLFTVVNVARRLNVDPELALRATTRRFGERVELAAELPKPTGDDWRALALDEQDRVLRRAKESST